ncbi:MAG: class I SAM-dependent methyltransferase [Pirellulales bacterium]
MPVNTIDPYERLGYPGFPLAQAHPNRLSTLARLMGMAPAPIETMRVLEIGCGDGTHLIGVAAGIPGAQLVGMDLAAAGIEVGRSAIAELGLTNIRLEQCDLMDFDIRSQEFDCVIAHGFYSWVPPAVRDRLLDVCRRVLSPQGVAYISYNTWPGCHQRQMLDEMMRYHVAEVEGISEKLEQARQLARFLSTAVSDKHAYGASIRHEAELIAGYRDSSLFHDDLAELNQPVYFHQFEAHARQFGLQYLSEAQYFETQTAGMSPEVVQTLSQLADDVVAFEQYLDFIKGRRFRQTLLCRDSVQLDRQGAASRVAELSVAGALREGAVSVTRDGQAAVTFQGPGGATMQTDQPLLRSAFALLGETWPRAIPFDRLLREAMQRRTESSGPEPLDADGQRAMLSQAMLRAYSANLVELHVLPSQFELEPGTYPVASPLARWQITRRETITNLRHYDVRVEDNLPCRLIPLLDGTRDRAALVDWFLANADSLPEGKELAHSRRRSQGMASPSVRMRAAGLIDAALKELGRRALLVAGT